MAKLESAKLKKQKGKKRKHGNVETEDEVANKSVIVEANDDQDEPMQTNSEFEKPVSIKKGNKRKSNERGAVEEKRSKLPEIDEVGDDFDKPTLEELKESEKSENNLAVISGRLKKKQKHKKLAETQKGQSLEKEKQRNAEYLDKWKHERNSWKFEKLRQISIMHSIFENSKLDANTWPIALEYLAGSKGSAKDKIVKLANDKIEQIDKICEQQETKEQREELLTSIEYQRARDLLQIFD